MNLCETCISKEGCECLDLSSSIMMDYCIGSDYCYYEEINEEERE